ncbi:hypothetical protein DFH94DRAFT_694514 [Russula ochroleuca]|uniref:DUF6535 domain-containing protein n=1 Tax=Russula ochroleuca TaxID=152965 RepID=A0A9P5MSF5_9AGAM|nr:hypothetical protein DFH94DRAFT_694514 [Russula ochroleuca]
MASSFFLFSAVITGLVAVTVQDLWPNGQDTSAFHLGNIYEVLADSDPNVTRASNPFPAKPPPFSPPRYAVWVLEPDYEP